MFHTSVSGQLVFLEMIKRSESICKLDKILYTWALKGTVNSRLRPSIQTWSNN